MARTGSISTTSGRTRGPLNCCERSLKQVFECTERASPGISQYVDGRPGRERPVPTPPRRLGVSRTWCATCGPRSSAVVHAAQQPDAVVRRRRPERDQPGATRGDAPPGQSLEPGARLEVSHWSPRYMNNLQIYLDRARANNAVLGGEAAAKPRPRRIHNVAAIIGRLPLHIIKIPEMGIEAVEVEEPVWTSDQ